MNTDPIGDPVQTRLSPADGSALDALIAAGMNPGRVDPGLRAGAERLAGLLGLLDRTPATDRVLADATLARVRREVRRAGAGVAAKLSAVDDEALESWVMHGYRPARVPSSLRARAARLQALADLVCGGSPVPAATKLIDATLSRVQHRIDAERDAMNLTAVRVRRGHRLADLAALAATLLIGAAVVWPVLGAARDYNHRLVCRSHLGAAGQALASYAGSNRDALPTATASLGGGRWWDVGCDEACANSANLFRLVRAGYATLDQLACPGNPDAPRGHFDANARDWRRLEEVSYSMQLVYGPRSRSWIASAPAPVLADRSPVVLAAVRGRFIDPFANAPNHGGAGQCVLYSDGSVRWYRSPVLTNGDNIWLPREIENRIEEVGRRLPAGSLSGRELPDGADDTVLGP